MSTEQMPLRCCFPPWSVVEDWLHRPVHIAQEEPRAGEDAASSTSAAAAAGHHSVAAGRACPKPVALCRRAATMRGIGRVQQGKMHGKREWDDLEVSEQRKTFRTESPNQAPSSVARKAGQHDEHAADS